MAPFENHPLLSHGSISLLFIARHQHHHHLRRRRRRRRYEVLISWKYYDNILSRAATIKPLSRINRPLKRLKSGDGDNRWKPRTRCRHSEHAQHLLPAPLWSASRPVHTGTLHFTFRTSPRVLSDHPAKPTHIEGDVLIEFLVRRWARTKPFDSVPSGSGGHTHTHKSSTVSLQTTRGRHATSISARFIIDTMSEAII